MKTLLTLGLEPDILDGRDVGCWLFRSMLVLLLVPIDVVVDCSDRRCSWTVLLIVPIDAGVVD